MSDSGKNGNLPHIRTRCRNQRFHLRRGVRRTPSWLRRAISHSGRIGNRSRAQNRNSGRIGNAHRLLNGEAPDCGRIGNRLPALLVSSLTHPCWASAQSRPCADHSWPRPLLHHCGRIGNRIANSGKTATGVAMHHYALLCGFPLRARRGTEGEVPFRGRIGSLHTSDSACSLFPLCVLRVESSSVCLRVLRFLRVEPRSPAKTAMSRRRRLSSSGQHESTSVEVLLLSPLHEGALMPRDHVEASYPAHQNPPHHLPEGSPRRPTTTLPLPVIAENSIWCTHVRFMNT